VVFVHQIAASERAFSSLESIATMLPAVLQIIQSSENCLHNVVDAWDQTSLQDLLDTLLLNHFELLVLLVFSFKLNLSFSCNSSSLN
jgi:hypothetical protein